MTRVLSEPKLFILLTLAAIAALAQEVSEPSRALRDTVLALDNAFFTAFNHCDLETWREYLDENVEFYQDNDDVTTTRADLEVSFLDRCDENHHSTLRRELVEQSTEVYPIQGFGAVQFGAHEFWVTKKGEPEFLGSTPRFVHLWRNRDGAWQITRVISYGH